jgi:polyhydroxybutyrate depolymerase
MRDSRRSLLVPILGIALGCGTGTSAQSTTTNPGSTLSHGTPDATTARPDATTSSSGGDTTDDASGAGDDGASQDDAGDDGSLANDGAPLSDAGPADAAPSVVCPDASLAAGDYPQTMPTEAGVRTFQIHVPPGLDPSQPAPLVFAFHGGGENAWQFEQFAHIHDKSDSSGFILVEADGTPALGPSAIPPPSPDAGIVLEVWNAGNCCEYAAQVNANVDDVGFVSAMIDTVEAQTCIDPKRVFATGFSNGGMLSHRLACQLSDRIASIVAVSGGSGATDYDMTPPEALFDCNPGRPVPVLHIHGTEDACYPFDGGWGPLSLVTFEPVMTTIQGWVQRNGCRDAGPTTVYTNDAATCELYPCPAEGQVELCTIAGCGHYWPGGDAWAGSTVFCGPNQGFLSSDIIANDAFWTWFTEHPMR